MSNVKHCTFNLPGRQSQLHEHQFSSGLHRIPPRWVAQFPNPIVIIIAFLCLPSHLLATPPRLRRTGKRPRRSPIVISTSSGLDCRIPVGTLHDGMVACRELVAEPAKLGVPGALPIRLASQLAKTRGRVRRVVLTHDAIRFCRCGAWCNFFFLAADATDCIKRAAGRRDEEEVSIIPRVLRMPAAHCYYLPTRKSHRARCCAAVIVVAFVRITWLYSSDMLTSRCTAPRLTSTTDL
ncbi:hypothetical protein BDV95DRAFT_600298 [Massariosphaeria phaeospora]|uniref:Uncharacterized protein n=1 Tax=Massariosphaeria phaeospora TaxID=100035 RepID=A0A7C8M1K3_9PLEO|nr:hypothetical protein BDV95DRAFT_600298 [Massariosphaeria phaeospora]